LRTRKQKTRISRELRTNERTSAKSRSKTRAIDRLKRKTDKPAGKPEKRVEEISGEPVDMAQVRTEILNMVGNSAVAIAREVIDAALGGELAPAKYLFDIAGVHPAIEQTGESDPEGDSLAEILLKRMGLPVEPVSQGEDFGSAGESQSRARKPVVDGEEDSIP
jgi:hypothetical protein